MTYQQLAEEALRIHIEEGMTLRLAAIKACRASGIDYAVYPTREVLAEVRKLMAPKKALAQPRRRLAFSDAWARRNATRVDLYG
jgi:hypothetical protein